MFTRKLLVILAVALFFCSLSFAVSDDEKAQQVLQKAASTLGWPDSVSSSEDSGDNLGTGRSYSISETGNSDADDLHATVAVFSTDQEPGIWLTFFNEQLDTEHSSYQGRDAGISTYGENCNPKPLVKALNDIFEGFFESIFGPSDDPNKGCVTDHGVVMWTCGKYILVATDNRDEEGGAENDIAAALYGAAQEAGLCEYGDTLVLMADTADRPGNALISDPMKMTQKINEYYGVNSMGMQPPFKFSFLDKDGSRGDDDWYGVDQPLASYHYPNANVPFGVDAIKKAFSGADVPQDLYFERVVVVYAGNGHQSDATAAFANACSYFADNQFVEVDAFQGKRRIYVKNIVLLSENRELGGWVHEFGHTLTSKYKNGAFYRISDRYNYDAGTSPERQFGDSSKWDLMCSGSHWGPNDGSTPTQMASFTKFAANWLTYRDAAINTSYTISALEGMKPGDAVLRLDNPLSANPESYMIIEGRDRMATFGAPASGVVLYDVYWDGHYNHHVVNDMTTQSGQTWITGSDGGYDTPTIYSGAPSSGSTYLIPPWQLKITATSMTRQPFSATVKVEPYNPVNLVGAVAHPGPAPVNGGLNASTTENALDDTLPDMDLHAYDSSGNHVGMNYETEQYENNIPGAIASGNLVGADEWIFVPEGTQVRYEISTYRTQQFLAANPELAASATPQAYNATAIKFDSQGKRYEADLGGGAAGAGATVEIKSPNDPSLKYQETTIPGVGNNSQVCPLLPAFLIFLLGGFLLKRPLVVKNSIK